MSSCDDSAEMKELEESECDSDESGLICFAWKIQNVSFVINNQIH